jgi:hypothetical protein
MKVENLYTSYKNIPIFKIILKNLKYSDLDTPNYKLIFIGPVKEISVRNLLQKIERGLELSNTDQKQLKIHFPYYKKIFGLEEEETDLIDSNTDVKPEYQIKFIYHYLETNTPISHLQFIIYEFLKNDKLGLGFLSNDYHPNNQLVYKYSGNMSIKHYIKLLNTIFKTNAILEADDFINGLINIFKISKDDLISRIKNINKKSNFLLQNEFNYGEVMNNIDLIKLCLQLPQFLNLDYKYLDGSHEYSYVEFNNIEKIIIDIQKNKKNIVLKQNISLVPYQEIGFLNINSFDKYDNNNIYIKFKKSCEPILPKNLLSFYFPDRKKYNIDNTVLNQYRHLFNSSVDTKIDKDNESTIEVKKMMNKSLIIELFSPEINPNFKLNLTDIFNLINTNYYMPIVKIVDNDSIHKFKIYKSFIQKHELSEISTLVEIRSHQKMKTHKISKKYLQIKWRITAKFILTINIYESGYMIAFFEEDSYIDISVNIIPFSSLINSTIRLIKKYLSLKHLSIPNVEQIFYGTSNQIYYNSIINCNIVINSSISIPYYYKNKQYNVNKVFNDIKQELKHYPQIITDESTHNYLKVFYKQVDNFYSLENIMQRINSYYAKKKDKVSKTERDSLVKFIKLNFYLDTEYINELIDKRDEYEITSNHGYLYGIEVNIKLDYDGNLTITIDNIDSFYSIRKIMFYLENILNTLKTNSQNESAIQSKKKLRESGILHDNEDLEIPDKGTKKKKSSGKKSVRDTNLDLDFDLDLDIDLDFDLDFDTDLLNLDVEQINSLEVKEDIQIDDIMNIEKDNGSSIIDTDLVGAKIKKYDLGDKKLKFKEYMKQMRKLYDPELYEVKGEAGNVIYSYGTDCDNKQMRQPMIVSKQDIDSYEKGSITGYMKYRNNYYICPRIWDYKANAPISVNKFIKNGLKSPYTQGNPIPTDKRDKVFLDDENTVIIRKGTTDTYWQDNEINKDWPEILKGTEKDAYPGLTASKKHPKKLCVPCCFKKPSKDFDPTIEEIQQIFRPNGFENCKGNFLEGDFDKNIKKDIASGSNNDKQYKNDETKGFVTKDINNINCKDHVSMYISNQTADLEKCKFGLLPKNLDLYFNNHQELFLHKNQYNLVENCNLLLRRGIDNNKRNNFLETMSVIYDRSYNNFINKLKDTITPELFITLNNGELISIYANQNSLPETDDDFNKFKLFIYKYQTLAPLFEFDISLIENMELNHIYDMQNEFKSNKNSLNMTEENMNIKKLMLLYKIYSSFYNYIAHILDPFEYKNYTHFIDLFTRPLTNLKSNDEYKNIMIFTEDNLLECNTFINIKRHYAIILIKKNNYHFVPVFNVILPLKEKVLKSIGIININNLNLSDEYFKYHKDKKKNVKLLEDTKLRKESIISNIWKLTNTCSPIQGNTKIFKLIFALNRDNIKIDAQVCFNNPNIEYLVINKNILLPIFPTNIRLNNDLIDRDRLNVDFNKLEVLNKNHIQSLDTYLKFLSTKKQNSNTNFNKVVNEYYQIKLFLYNIVKKKIIGIKFNSNLVVPIQEETLNKDKLISFLKVVHNDKKLNKDDLDDYIENVLYDFNIQISDENTNISNKNMIMNDLLYHQFKFEFSKKINEILIIKQKIKDLLFNIRKTEVHKRDKHIYDLQVLIFKFMKRFIYNSDIQKDIKKGFKFVKCNRLSKRKCLKNPFCFNQNTKKVVNISKKRSKKASKSKKSFSKSSISFRNDSLLDMDETSMMDDKIYKKLVAKQDKLGIINEEFFNNLEPILKKYQKDCQFVLNNKLLHYFCYLLSLDMINNKLQSKNIINGNYVPKFINILNIFNNDKQIITNLKELTYLLENNLESKNKNNVLLNYRKSIENKYFFKEDDYEHLKKWNKQFFDDEKKIKNIDSNIYTTYFNKDGEYNKDMESSKCLFPFLTKRGNLIDKCIYSVDGSGLKCPTKLDSYRNPIKWGYCPEKKEVTIDRLDIQEINTIGDKKDYMAGKCQFPYIDLDTKKIKIFNDCQLDKKKKLTWCPTELNYNKESLLMAASNIEDIYGGKWNNTDIVRGNKISSKYSTKKKGICKTTEELNEIEILKKNDDITYDNYQINKCILPLKKGGYTKLQLLDFGTKVLDIPINELKDGDKAILKDQLCNKINETYRKKQLGSKPITDYERANVYQKKLGQCLEGENKGGYYKSELREMGIKYFDLDDDKSQNMSKKELCEYIIPKVIEVRKKLGVSIESGKSTTKVSSISKKDLDKLYPGKIEKCNESPQRGGLNIKKLKKIANENFGIDIGNMQKEEICSAIEEKMKEIYQQLLEEEDEEKIETVLDLDDVDKLLDL